MPWPNLHVPDRWEYDVAEGSVNWFWVLEILVGYGDVMIRYLLSCGIDDVRG